MRVVTPDLSVSFAGIDLKNPIIAASGTAVDPSYIDAFATSMPVSWQIIVWNSKKACSDPCEASAW